MASPEENSRDAHFEELLTKLQAGDQQAAREIVDRFRGRLLHLAARQFDTWLREKADPEGVVQSALFSFFRRAQEGSLSPDGWDEIAAILAVITIRKCSNRRKFLLAEKRDASKEVLNVNGETEAWEPVNLFQFGPEDEAIFQELYDWLLRGFEDRERAIVELAFQGSTASQIAEQLQRPVRTVRRVMSRLRDRVERLRQQDGW